MSRGPGGSTKLSVLLGVQDPKNSDAWRGFVEVYRPEIVCWCEKLGLQPSDAEDVAQDVLYKLLNEMRRFQYDPNGSFRGWLYRVTRNAVTDFLRKRRRFRVARVGNTTLRRILHNVECSATSEDLVETLAGEFRRHLMHQAEGLVRRRVSPQTWAAYTARGRGEPARKVGQELGMQIAAVHKAKSRVLRMIREELAILLGGRIPPQDAVD